MIIQCEQCLTRFRLDDAKVKAKGVMVRCAKCRHVFTVTKQQDEMEPPPGDVTGLEQPAASPVAPHVAGGSPFAPLAEGPASAPTGGGEPGFSFSDDAWGSEASDAVTATQSSELDFSDMDFGDVPQESGHVTAPAAADPRVESLFGDAVAATQSSELDFSDMDFGDVSQEIGRVTAPAAADPRGESLFGDAVAAPTPEGSAGPITFDFPVEAFADSMGTEEKAGAGKGSIAGGNHEAKVDEPFSLGDIDFGDELTSVAVQHVNPEELKPSKEFLFAPLAEAQGEKESEPQEDLPPLFIASRRKKSPLFMGLVIALVVVAVAALGYLGYSMFGVEKVAKESGRITIRGVNATFVQNSAAGELIVISGEAVNEYVSPRASIQVKGMVYGPNGQVLASKSAFCGNPLAKEQLSAMPLDKIEAAMANQFGDSLGNMGVQPGKAIPFMIVIANQPAAAKEFGVEPAGSTVAAGKQQ